MATTANMATANATSALKVPIVSKLRREPSGATLRPWLAALLENIPLPPRS